MADIQTKYAIIGASAAGMSGAQAIRELDPGGTITVFSGEPDPPYFRPLVPFLISGRKTANQMRLMGTGPYQGSDIDVRLNAPVAGIDTGDKRLTLARGETVSYEKLLVATGSRPRVPTETSGTEAPGVFAVRTLADAQAAHARVAVSRRAVMLGGGMLNLKVAFALLERNIEVTLVVRSPEILSQLMEPADTTLIRAALLEAGLKIETGVSVTQIMQNDSGVNGVVLDDGRELPAEMVCLGKGVEPNVAFIAAGTIHVDRGVVVDRFTRTSEPDVYAAGDVAVTFDPITGNRIVTGLWTNAAEMGRQAGRNMAGRPGEYAGTFGILNATQVAGLPFVSMGIVHGGGGDYQVFANSRPGAYSKMVFSPDGEKLVGMVLVGDISRAGLYRLLIREGRPVKNIQDRIIRHSLHYGHLIRA